jgi:hypothetical protein
MLVVYYEYVASILPRALFTRMTVVHHSMEREIEDMLCWRTDVAQIQKHRQGLRF